MFLKDVVNIFNKVDTMNKKSSFVLILVLLLSACTTPQSINSTDISLIDDDSPLQTERVFEPNCRFVKFQNANRESVITGIERLLCTEDRFFVLDRRGNKLLSFDKNGTFLRSTTSMIGKSKNEYISLFDATLDKTSKRIYVYCDAPCKLMIFDYDLNVIDNIDFPIFTWELSVDDNYLYCLSPDLEDGKIMRLMCVDKKNPSGAAKELLSTQSAIPELGTNGKSIIHCDDCYFAMPFEQSIYHIKNGMIIDAYHVAFDDLWFDSDANDTGLSDFLRINRNRHWMITNICPSDSTILFNTNKFHSFVINRKTNQCTSYRGIVDSNIPIFSSRLIPTDGLYGYAVYEMSLGKIKSVIDKAIGVEIKGIDPTVVKLASEYKTEDNPTVCIWKIK